ncbi:hypothetical protein CGG93_24885 [Vibrio parahaemolyticus]|nr:hypothetical protein CGG93_24885 [Vibrio parahaemolyticus]
MVLVVKVFCGN